jgi:hypothetical protein
MIECTTSQRGNQAKPFIPPQCCSPPWSHSRCARESVDRQTMKRRKVNNKQRISTTIKEQKKKRAKNQNAKHKNTQQKIS